MPDYDLDELSEQYRHEQEVERLEAEQRQRQADLATLTVAIAPTYLRDGSPGSYQILLGNHSLAEANGTEFIQVALCYPQTQRIAWLSGYAVQWTDDNKRVEGKLSKGEIVKISELALERIRAYEQRETDNAG